ncbi:MAG: DUF3196 family protein [Mycoplasmoidaceae bacterium]
MNLTEGQEMNNIEKFYSKILNDIEEMIKSNDINKAIKIIEDELETPYIPIEFYDKFEEKLLDLKFTKNYMNDKKNLDKISKEDFLEKNNDKINEIDIIYFFKKFGDKLSKDNIDILFKKMESKKLSNSKKIVILENLKNKDLEKKFIFFNNNTKKNYEIDFKKIGFIESIDFFNEVNNKLENIIDQDPTIIELCYTVIYSFYEYFFPEFDFLYSSEEFLLSLINCIENMLKGTDLILNKASKDLQKVIKNIR